MREDKNEGRAPATVWIELYDECLVMKWDSEVGYKPNTCGEK